MRAGFPTTTAPDSTLCVTTLPAPTRARSPMVTNGRTVAFMPIWAPRSIVGPRRQRCESVPGCGSSARQTPGPIVTSSAMVLNRPMLQFAEIVTRSPMTHEASMIVLLPTRQSSPSELSGPITTLRPVTRRAPIRAPSWRADPRRTVERTPTSRPLKVSERPASCPSRTSSSINVPAPRWMPERARRARSSSRAVSSLACALSFNCSID